MNGLLFVIDGTDGTGKNTQAKLLYEALLESFSNVELVSFPNYGSPGCTMVEKYLNGEFCDDPAKIDCYTASMFYTIDRSISYQNDQWGKVYRNGGIVIADRYYTSNMIHQGAKILMELKNTPDASESHISNRLEAFNEWIIHNEVDRIRLPKPNKTFWLVADKNSNERMLNNRLKHNSSHNTDIHESNKVYLDYCREAILYHRSFVQSKDDDSYINPESFINVNDHENNLRSKEDIHNEILKHVLLTITQHTKAFDK